MMPTGDFRAKWITPQGWVHSNVAGRALRTYPCRYCNAPIGQGCVSPTGRPAQTHADRIDQWDADDRPIRHA